MAKWSEIRKGGDFNAIAAECGISPVLARLLRNRDVVGTEAIREYLYGGLESLNDPRLLPDVGKASSLLKEALAAGAKIRVIGDYDVDGIASTYILVTALREKGADVSYVLPERLKDGYGLNERMIEEAASDGVNLILTCDNGVAAAGPIRRAREAGMTVIVTDHHEVPYEMHPDGRKEYILPDANAIVEPKRVDETSGEYTYPFRDICGAVVALKLMQVFYAEDDPGKVFTERTDPNTGELFRDFLAFAAIASICDVMPLADENRILVREGLKEAGNTRNPGLKALIDVQGLTGMPITTYHAGFVLGPCLNASGRLDTAERALSLFTDCIDPEEAGKRAEELKELNDSRKSMTEQGKKQAAEMIEREGLINDRVLVLYLPGCHESIAGIIAGKVKEKYVRPVFVLTDAQQEGFLKGSGRSIEEYDMYAEMNRIADVFTQFGGHKMAAGLTIPRERLVEFRTRINANCKLTEQDLTKVLRLDMVLPAKYLTEELAEEIRKMEPCGTGNLSPLFASRNFTVTKIQVAGKKRNVVRLSLSDERGYGLQGIWFGDADEMENLFDANCGQGTFDALCETYGYGGRRGYGTSFGGIGYTQTGVKVHAAYRLTLHEYRGRRDLQLTIEDLMFVR